MNLENDIEPRALELYDSARVDAVNSLRQNFDVIAVYEIGTVNSPGISDLDLMMVLNPVDQIASGVPELATILPKNVRSLLGGGTIMVLDPRLFSSIRIWDDVRTRLLWGENLEPATVDAPAQMLHIARAVDWIPERTLRLAQMIQMESVKTSRAIGLVYSLCHSLRTLLAEFNPVNAQEINSFIESIDNLRASWFKTDYRSLEQDLTRSVELGLHIGMKAIHLLENQLSEVGLVDSGAEGELELGRTGRLLFRKNEGDSIPDFDRDSISLPTIFYQHFRNYALGDGMISQRIRSSLKPEPDRTGSEAENGYTPVLRERIEWAEQQAKLLSVLGFTTGMYKFGWYFSPSTRGVE